MKILLSYQVSKAHLTPNKRRHRAALRPRQSLLINQLQKKRVSYSYRICRMRTAFELARALTGCYHSRMKRISTIFCTACVLTMSACQQQLPPEVAAAVAEAEKTHGHICNDDMLSCELGLCPVGRARRAAFEALEARQQNNESEAPSEQTNSSTRQTNTTTEQPRNREEETERNITPSAEQMESARNMMQEAQATPARSTNRAEASHAEPVNYVPAYVGNSSGVPGRSGLRMGHFAPPEEAVSTSENAAPLPNAAERHGLRSPSLPNTLPMSIDGRTNNAR